jgi:hypothetical protein
MVYGGKGESFAVPLKIRVTAKHHSAPIVHPKMNLAPVIFFALFRKVGTHCGVSSRLRQQKCTMPGHCCNWFSTRLPILVNR